MNKELKDKYNLGPKGISEPVLKYDEELETKAYSAYVLVDNSYVFHATMATTTKEVAWYAAMPRFIVWDSDFSWNIVWGKSVDTFSEEVFLQCINDFRNYCKTNSKFGRRCYL